MQRLDEAESSAVREAVRRFLHADCIGCRFAQNFIKTGEGASWVIFVGDLSASVGEDLTAVLDQAAQSGELAVLIFPELRGPEQVLALIDTLAGSARWSVDSEQGERFGSSVRLSRLYWTNPRGEKVSIMGMAPMLSMPVTRRAPFVSLMAWPGDRSNRFRTKPFPEIGIGDMPLPDPLDADGYREMRKSTEAKAAELNGEMLAPGITFVLPR